MLKTVFKFFVLLSVQILCSAQISTLRSPPENSLPNFGTVSSINSFPNAYSSASASPGSFGQPIFSYPPVNNFSPSATSSSFNTGSPQLSTVPSSLETFISTFSNAIHSSPILADVFEISQISLKDLADFIYQAVYTHATSIGISDPHDILTYATQPIVENFKVLTYPMLVKINANAMGKHLLAEGILNDMNAATLASAFANELETSAKKTVDKSSHESKVQALISGYANFLKSQGLYKQEKAASILKYYGDEYKILN